MRQKGSKREQRYGDIVGYAGGGMRKTKKKPKKAKIKGTGAATKGTKFSKGY